jgi:hypothetical protein
LRHYQNARHLEKRSLRVSSEDGKEKIAGPLNRAGRGFPRPAGCPGRPVVTQDTGFGNVLPSGRGLFAFRGPPGLRLGLSLQPFSRGQPLLHEYTRPTSRPARRRRLFASTAPPANLALLYAERPPPDVLGHGPQPLVGEALAVDAGHVRYFMSHDVVGRWLVPVIADFLGPAPGGVREERELGVRLGGLARRAGRGRMACGPFGGCSSVG